MNTLLSKETEKLILEKTPKQFIKKRPGRGGMQLSYVETGYIIKKLNEVFNYLWDFEIVSEKIGDAQIYVQGKLTVHLSPEMKIVKMQYGGSDIKKNTSTGKPTDIADDMKSASSDALKKCASLLGISQDVFWPSGAEEEVEETGYDRARREQKEVLRNVTKDEHEAVIELYEDERINKDVPVIEATGPITFDQNAEVIRLLAKKGKTLDDLKNALKPFKKTSHNKLTAKEAETLLKKLRSLPDVTEQIGITTT